MPNKMKNDGDKDLPLMSNTDEILVDHYVLFFKCDFTQCQFRCRVYLFLRPLRPTNHPTDFKLVLDSKDITVEKVEDVRAFTHPNGERTPVTFRTLTMKDALEALDGCPTRKSLPYRLDDWSVTIWNGEDDIQLRDPAFDFCPRVVCIHYRTMKKGASVTWVKDQSGRDCCFTHGTWINNRSLFPCQEPPVAMATWQAFVTVPTDALLVISGDSLPTKILNETSSENGITYYSYTRMRLPMSTLAMAIGFWTFTDLSTGAIPLLEPSERAWQEYSYDKDSVQASAVHCRIVGPDSILDKATKDLGTYLLQCLECATQLLGPYPFRRLDIVLMPRCFDSLGLASPNVTFVSQCLLAGDGSMRVHLAHELAHGWFGLLIGAQDWTEEWLSEGFATYMEDLIHISAMNWAANEANNWQELRIYLRHRTLMSELENTNSELQTLRPVKELLERRDNKISAVYVKNGMNPDKAFIQVHYLKGYFLLKHLSDLVGTGEFNGYLKHYVRAYQGQLVHSQEILRTFCEHFPSVRAKGVTVDKLNEEWLDCPEIPVPVKLYAPSLDNPLFNEIQLQREWWKTNESFRVAAKRKQSKRPKLQFEGPKNKLTYSDQLVILLELLLEEPRLSNQILAHLCQHYDLERKNANVRHRWCELVVKHNFRKGLSAVERFLLEDQGMGVYLYGELILSEKRNLQAMARKCYDRVRDEISLSSRLVVGDMLEGL